MGPSLNMTDMETDQALNNPTDNWIMGPSLNVTDTDLALNSPTVDNGPLPKCD